MDTPPVAATKLDLHDAMTVMSIHMLQVRALATLKIIMRCNFVTSDRAVEKKILWSRIAGVSLIFEVPTYFMWSRLPCLMSSYGVCTECVRTSQKKTNQAYCRNRDHAYKRELCYVIYRQICRKGWRLVTFCWRRVLCFIHFDIIFDVREDEHFMVVMSAISQIKQWYSLNYGIQPNKMAEIGGWEIEILTGIEFLNPFDAFQYHCIRTWARH